MILRSSRSNGSTLSRISAPQEPQEAIQNDPVVELSAPCTIMRNFEDFGVLIGSVIEIHNGSYTVEYEHRDDEDLTQEQFEIFNIAPGVDPTSPFVYYAGTHRQIIDISDSRQSHREDIGRDFFVHFTTGPSEWVQDIYVAPESIVTFDNSNGSTNIISLEQRIIGNVLAIDTSTARNALILALQLLKYPTDHSVNCTNRYEIKSK